VAVGGMVTDQVTDTIGFRSFALTMTDCTLNGASIRLRGVGKHQETEAHASAVTDQELIQDWDNIKDLGINFVRLAHYPHAQLEYDLADQRGLFIWAENGHTNSGPPSANGESITREMIFQNFNHPSIVFWSVGNEANGQPATERYADVARAADASRPIVYATNGLRPAKIDQIWTNTYLGWYGDTPYVYLLLPLPWVSETGAGMSIATHTGDPFAMKYTIDNFEPEEYGALVNEIRFDDLYRKPNRVVAFANWVFRDFSDSKYKGAINSKGLMTFAGYKKDVYYHFKSFLKPAPLIHLVGATHFLRDSATGAGGVKAYSNAANLTLTVNGVAKGMVANDTYKHPNATPIKNAFYWPGVLSPGKNVVVASDGQGNSDTMTVFLRAGATMPATAGAKVANLVASNATSAAFFIDTPLRDQWPFYYDFDGTGENTVDVVPDMVKGAGWIATRRQSDGPSGGNKTTGLTFDLPTGGDVFIMFTKPATGGAPAWITAAGFTDTGVTGNWRDNTLKLVPYQLFKKTAAAGTQIKLASMQLDYLVLVK
jgi:beta-galactosidase